MFWQKNLINFFVEVAHWAADKPNVPGILTDVEMYGADRSGFADACFCRDCLGEVSAHMGLSAESINLDDAATRARYREASTSIVRRLATKLRKDVRAVFPTCLLGGYILDHFDRDMNSTPFHKGNTTGWGTKQLPVLVVSEATYETGYHAAYAEPDRPLLRGTGSGKTSVLGIGDHPGYVQSVQETYRRWGAHAQLVLGLWINRIPNENFAENIYHMAVNTRGYWIYDLMPLGESAMHSEHAYLKFPGEGQPAYWEAIRHGNAELDRQLASKGRYISPLALRAFTLPAPGVTMERWRAMDLPVSRGGSDKATFLCLREETHHYMPVGFGDQVRFSVEVDSAHPTKKKRDAVAIVVEGPTGDVVYHTKFGFADLSENVAADGRWHGQREVSFTAAVSGTYCAMLNGVRYSYGIGASSHGWLLSLQGPLQMLTPQKLVFKTRQDASVVKLLFGSPVPAEVRDAGGGVMNATMQEEGPGRHRLVIAPVGPNPQVITVVLPSVPRTLALKAHSGIEPRVAATPNAPFPGH